MRTQEELVKIIEMFLKHMEVQIETFIRSRDLTPSELITTNSVLLTYLGDMLIGGITIPLSGKMKLLNNIFAEISESIEKGEAANDKRIIQ